MRWESGVEEEETRCGVRERVLKVVREIWWAAGIGGEEFQFGIRGPREQVYNYVIERRQLGRVG